MRASQEAHKLIEMILFPSMHARPTVATWVVIAAGFSFSWGRDKPFKGYWCCFASRERKIVLVFQQIQLIGKQEEESSTYIKKV